MFELSKQSQDFGKVSVDGYRLTLAALSKAWLPALIGNILLLAPIFVIHFLLQDLFAEESGWILWIIFAALVLYPALMASVLLAVNSVAQGRTINLVQALGGGIRCSIPTVIGTVLFIVFISIGSVLLFLPGIFLFISLSFWWFGVVIEKKAVLAAFRSSFKFVYGAWWRTVAVLGGSYVMPLALLNATDKLLELIPDAYSEHTVVAISTVSLYLIINVFVIVIAPILFSALMIVQFNDLKRRASARIASTNNAALPPPNTSKPTTTSATSNPGAGTA